MCIFRSKPLVLAFRLSQSWPHPVMEQTHSYLCFSTLPAPRLWLLENQWNPATKCVLILADSNLLLAAIYDLVKNRWHHALQLLSLDVVYLACLHTYLFAINRRTSWWENPNVSSQPIGSFVILTTDILNIHWTSYVQSKRQKRLKPSIG